MASSVNKVILVGRMGKDPEVRYTSSGAAVAGFSLATDESYKDKSGEKVKKTEWHNIVVWGKAVESFVQPYLHKGDMIYVEGKLQTRSWEDKKNGGTRYTTEINVTDIKGLVTANVDAAPAAPKATAARPAAARPAAARPAPAAAPIDDEDIQF